MIATPTFTVSSPELSDIATAEIGSKLKIAFTWLNEAFGKVQKAVKEKNGRKYIYPAIHTATEHLNLLPDEHIGNYCYFDPVDPLEIETFARGYPSRLKQDFGIVFWFNYKDVYPDDWATRTIDNIEANLLEFFRDTTFKNSSLIVTSIEEETDNIYKGYNHEEIKQQFMMRPFRAIRFNITMRFQESC